MSDLATLFARNPLELTREDLTTIVTTFRQSRHKFSLGNAKAGSTKPKTAKQKEIESIADAITIDL